MNSTTTTTEAELAELVERIAAERLELVQEGQAARDDLRRRVARLEALEAALAGQELEEVRQCPMMRQH